MFISGDILNLVCKALLDATSFANGLVSEPVIPATEYPGQGDGN